MIRKLYIYIRAFGDRIDVNVAMCEGDEIGRAATAIADHDGHRRRVLHIDKHRLNDVGAALDDQAHEWNGMVILQCDCLPRERAQMN